MNSVRALIVDDEEPGRQNLQHLIHTYCPGIEVIGQAGSAIEARTFIQHEHPDLIFVDVEMPDETGIDLLESLSQPGPRVIFVTAHDQYALKAIRLSAIDYLLKPISIKELQMAIGKVMDRIKAQRDEQQQHASEKLSVPCTGGYEIIEKNSILYLQGDNNYTNIVTRSRKYVVTRTLKEFEPALDGRQFVRVHKTHIVNLQCVKQVQHQDGGFIVMDDGSHISISRRRYAELISQLSHFAPLLRSS